MVVAEEAELSDEKAAEMTCFIAGVKHGQQLQNMNVGKHREIIGETERSRFIYLSDRTAYRHLSRYSNTNVTKGTPP